MECHEERIHSSSLNVELYKGIKDNIKYQANGNTSESLARTSGTYMPRYLLDYIIRNCDIFDYKLIHELMDVVDAVANKKDSKFNKHLQEVIDLPIIYEKTRFSEVQEPKSINDFISEHIDMKLKDLAKLINDNYDQFSDGSKDISDAAISVRRQRLIKKLNQNNTEESEVEETTIYEQMTIKDYIINHPEMKPK